MVYFSAFAIPAHPTLRYILSSMRLARIEPHFEKMVLVFDFKCIVEINIMSSYWYQMRA